MNRSRSSDSLDNGDDNIICSSSGSSSPTDFTSDDEASNISMLLSRQPTSKSKSRKAEAPAPMKFHSDMLNLLRSQDYIDNVDQASTSFYSKRPILSDRDLGDCYRRDVSSGGRLWYDENKTGAQPDQLVLDSENSENFRILPVGEHDLEDEQGTSDHTTRGGTSLDQVHFPSVRGKSNNGNIYPDYPGQRQRITLPGYQHEPIATPINSRASMVGATSRICSRLVEFRNLIDAIEFIELNRGRIDNLTRIVTREAPAFRDYDLSNYQTDYSVKESFNPNFWLDREPIVTTADGNCQYHAVSISLTGSEAYTPEVRLATAVAVIDNRQWFDSMLKLIDRGTVLDLVHTIARSHSWGDETTLKAIAVAINRRIFLYTCNIGKKDYEMVKSLSKEELLDAFREKKYRGGTGIHTYADPLHHVSPNNYIMLFHKSEHFIAVLPTNQTPTMFEPYNPIVPIFN